MSAKNALSVLVAAGVLTACGNTPPSTPQSLTPPSPPLTPPSVDVTTQLQSTGFVQEGKAWRRADGTSVEMSADGKQVSAIIFEKDGAKLRCELKSAEEFTPTLTGFEGLDGATLRKLGCKQLPK